MILFVIGLDAKNEKEVRVDQKRRRKREQRKSVFSRLFDRKIAMKGRDNFTTII